MEIIDAHVHLYPPEINRAPAAWATTHAEPHWSRLCTRTRKNGRPVQAFPDLATLLRAMDAAGVSRAILQAWYWETPESGAFQNRFYAECVRLHPDRLAACAALNPRAGAVRVRDEIRRAADSGFAGLGELSPHAQNISPDDPALHAAFALAGELNLAVNLHATEFAGAAGARNYPGKIATPPADFVTWAQTHPRTRFVLAHWGARLPLLPLPPSAPSATPATPAPQPPSGNAPGAHDAHDALGAAIRAAKNIFYDTAASPLIHGADSPALWRQMTDAAGAGRILFGTDYPLVLHPKTETEPSMTSLVAEAKTSGLNESELAAVFSENARRVFNLKTGYAD